VSSTAELMATVKSKRERIIVAAAFANFCTLNKAQKTAFFGLANDAVFLSPKGRQMLFKDLEDKGLYPPPDDFLSAAADYYKISQR
jgi:hypothetical protein